MDQTLKQAIPLPPNPIDHNGWQRAVAQNLHLKYDAQVLFCALQGLGVKANVQMRNALAGRLSHLVIKYLRRKVSTYHPNEGWDIIYRAQDDVFTAAAKPNSSDGIGFRKAFYLLLNYRLLSAIKDERRERRTEEDILAEKANKTKQKASVQHDVSECVVTEEELIEDDENLAELEGERTVIFSESVVIDDDAPPEKATYDPTLFEGVNELIEQIDVNRLLEKHVPDLRKRTVFHLFMDDVPYRTERKEITHSIADAMGINESTAREWIKEVKEILREQIRRL